MTSSVNNNSGPYVQCSLLSHEEAHSVGVTEKHKNVVDYNKIIHKTKTVNMSEENFEKLFNTISKN